jgi:hypothetical protein
MRARWRTVLIVGVLTGVVAGIGLATLAGARRTDTLFDRHLAASAASDVEIDPGLPTAEVDRAMRSMPEVAGATYWAVISAFLLDDEGRIDPNTLGPLALTTDGRYVDQDRVGLHAGRHLDPTRPDEVMVNEFAADVLGVGVGASFELGLVPSDADGAPIQDTPTHQDTVRVVGIMAPPDEVVGSELDRVPKMFVSPAFGDVLDSFDPAYVGFAWYGLRLREGEADVGPVVARWQGLAEAHNAALPDGHDESEEWLTFVRRTADLTRTADRGVRPMVAALATFGGLVLFGALVLLMQGLARIVRQGHDDTRTAQVLGLTSGDATISELAVPAAVVIVAAVIAVGVAVVVSSWFPAGPYQVLEPDPGVDVDLTTLLAGVVVLMVPPLLTSAVVARRQSRRDVLDRRPAPARASTTVARLAQGGASPPLVSAVRFTVESGRGRTYVPTRLVLVSSVVTVALLIATLVFGENLSSLSRDPERFGWAGDGLVMMDGGYGRIDPDVAVPWLATRGELDGWRLVGADRVVVNGREAPGLVYGPDDGTGAGLVPVLVSGRSPLRAGEVVLGRQTLKELGAEVGDEVTLGEGDRSRTASVTGSAVFPELGPVLAIRTRLDDGVWAHPDDADAFASLSAYGWPYNALLVDLAEGATVGAVAAAVEDSPIAYSGGAVDSYGVLEPAEVESAASAGRVQAALVAVVAVVAVLSLFLTLVAVVRRRRRDLSILSALGFTPRQLRITFVLQGLLFGLAGVLLGTPLGIVLGRVLWVTFAGTLGVVTDPTMSWSVIAVVAAAVVAIGVLGSIPPALAAGRLDPSPLTVE